MAAIPEMRSEFGQSGRIVRRADIGAGKMISTSVSAQSGDAHTVHGRRIAQSAVFSVIMALSFSHFLNDMMQSLVPALYPMWKSAYGLSFAQIGLISLVTQVTSS